MGSKRIWFFLVFFSLLGIISSSYLLHIFFKVCEDNTTGASLCSFNAGMDCEIVAQSKFSALFGVPLAIYGIIQYVVFLVGLIWMRFKKNVEFLWSPVIFWVCFFVFLNDMYLMYVQVTVINSICVVCVFTYFINLCMIVFLLIDKKWSLTFFLRGLLSDIIYTFKKPVRIVIFILFTGGIIGALFYFTKNPIGIPKVIAKQPEIARVEEYKCKCKEQEQCKQGMFSPEIGNPDASVKITVISDYQCPFCSKADEVIEKIVETYDGNIYIEHIDVPLDHSCNPYVKRPFHIFSCIASVSARCAAKQGKCWQMHKLLFLNQKNLSEEVIVKLAESLHLDMGEFTDCFVTQRDQIIKNEVLPDIERAFSTFKLRGTPTIIINDMRYEGFLPYPKIKSIIDGLLKPVHQ